ncbi:Choline-sulfatase (plasmid) [Komagataeibacter saccharivorans]|uniref:Choline-sulfatase n=1 Tax=Komagataeibacter saccharivorans TaxID=265959 RepID=A0A347WH42_9PROT|nr:choline-sulfatase [Komagataeibacter saccharivorans]AXY24185.1 Choline-sulfatase [Komagataeibacter saccharivorans]
MPVQPSNRPNFLVVLADQLTAALLPAVLGGRDPSPVIAPNLTDLAAQGVVFSNAYTNSPLCGPSRAAFMSGLLPTISGVYDNACEWHADTPTFGHRLRLSGYRTILSGKMHFVGPDQLHGFEERLTTDIYPADFSWVPDWLHPEIRPDWYHSMDSVHQAGPVVRSNQIDYDEEVAFTTRRKLYDLARVRDGRPFCMLVSFTHPHDPFNIGQEWWDRYADVPIPSPRVDMIPDDHPSVTRIRETCGIAADPATPQAVARARRAYFGAISYIDHQVGRLRAVLRETGLDRNTVIVFTSDHGEMLGEHGLWYKMSFYEGASRVPLIFSGPDFFRPRIVRDAVSLVDVGETLCGLSGAPPAPRTDGRSLVLHLNGSGGHDGVFGEYCGEGTTAPVSMIRRGRWKFIHSPGEPDQLFDLSGDPDETHNLNGSNATAAILTAFSEEAHRKWDYARITRAVIASQQRRRLVSRALAIGTCTHWDYQPPPNAHNAYIRNHKPLETLEAEARLYSPGAR